METKVRQKVKSVLRLQIFGCLFTIIFLSFGSAPTNAQMVTDSQIGKLNVIKLLANLARFVTWPDSTFSAADAPFRYCIMGRDDIGTLLDDALGGANANGRGFEISRLGLDQVDQTSNCHLVFIGVDAAEEAGTAIGAVGNNATITVAQVEGFTDAGGMVQFVGSDRNVTLKLNQVKLEATPLTVSSKLYAASQH